MVVGPSSFPISCAPIFGVDAEAARCQAKSIRAERLIPASPALRKKSRRDSSLSMTNLLRTICGFAQGSVVPSAPEAAGVRVWPLISWGRAHTGPLPPEGVHVTCPLVLVATGVKILACRHHAPTIKSIVPTTNESAIGYGCGAGFEPTNFGL